MANPAPNPNPEPEEMLEEMEPTPAEEILEDPPEEPLESGKESSVKDKAQDSLEKLKELELEGLTQAVEAMTAETQILRETTQEVKTALDKINSLQSDLEQAIQETEDEKILAVQRTEEAYQVQQQAEEEIRQTKKKQKRLLGIF